MKKNSRILCIGLGKLGLIFSQILSEKVSDVIGYEVDKKIIKSVNKNEKSIEPELNKLIRKNKNKFHITKSLSTGIQNSSSAFLILPTPSKKNKEFDNSYIEKCLDKIGPFLKNKKKYLINITSTVNPGSCEIFIKRLEKKYKLKHGKHFVLTYNPHLIALGSIYKDVLFPDFVLIGSNLKSGFKLLENIYNKLYPKKLSLLKMLNLREAEIAKISINSYITMKISFTNLISQISDKVDNIDVSNILNVIGEDKRIGKKYLSLGASYSGPCFPRDNLNFISYLKKNKLNYSLLKSTEEINNIQIARYLKILKEETKGLKKPTIGLCGLSYKENTSLATRSPAKDIFNNLKKKFDIILYDTNFVDEFPKTNYYKSQKLFFHKSDIIFVCNKNKNFKKFGSFKTKRKKTIIDLWNFINTKNDKIEIKKIGIS